MMCRYSHNIKTFDIHIKPTNCCYYKKKQKKHRCLKTFGLAMTYLLYHSRIKYISY